MSLGPGFPARKFRMLMQFPAQFYSQLQKPFIQLPPPFE
jgi:hypothetical protein